MFSRKSTIVVSLSILVLVSIVGMYFFVGKKGDTTIDTGSHESEVVSGEFVDMIRTTGTARLAYEQKLRFSGGGKVSEVFAKAGQVVKKGELLAQLDMQEYNEILVQVTERASFVSQKLKIAREKIGGLELQKLQAELQSLESKRTMALRDLEKLNKTAGIKTQTKRLEFEQKKSEIESKEISYTIEYKLWEKDMQNKDVLFAKKESEVNKVVTDTLTNARTELADFQVLYNNFNAIFGFEAFRLSSEERSDAIYNGWNVAGFRQETENLWRNLKDPISNLSQYIASIDGKKLTIDHAFEINKLSLVMSDVALRLADQAKKTMDATESQIDNSFSQNELDAVRAKVNGYRNTIISKNNLYKDTKNLLPLISSPELLRAQIEKDLLAKKLVLDSEKIALEKLKTEILESDIKYLASGSIDTGIANDITTKKQEILDLEVSIATKQSDIQKQSSGTSDEIVSLESELKQAQSELNKSRAKREQYEMRAPIDGVIRAVKLLPGDAVGTTNATGNEGTIIIEDSNAVLVVAKLGQKDIVRIKQNGEANIAVDAFPGATFTGTITEISSSPDEGGGGGEILYEIRILFDKGEYAIYSGMSATIEIYMNKKENVIFIPLTAVTTDTQTGESYVTLVSTQGGKEKRIVILGQIDGDRVEVLSGINPGEKVLSIDFSAVEYQETPSKMP